MGYWGHSVRGFAKLQSTIYLPPWTCKELQEAAHALGFPFDDDEIEKRFEMFGGVARHCLNRKQPAVDRAARRIVQVVEGITKPMDIRALIMAWDDDSTRQRVFHYVPYGYSSVMMAKFTFSFIEKKCSAVMQQASREDQRMLRQTIEDMDEQLPREWIWQFEAHERLRQGCELQLHALQLDMGMPALESITIELTETCEGFNTDSLSPLEATRGPYYQLKSNTMDSINAFYLPTMPERADGQDIVAWWESNPDSRLVLFQMTVSKSSDVNAFGVIHVLDKLGLLESVAKEPWRVALVYMSYQENGLTDAMSAWRRRSDGTWVLVAQGKQPKVVAPDMVDILEALEMNRPYSSPVDLSWTLKEHLAFETKLRAAEDSA
ncbi:hypothetical protein PHYSODRAFT_260121 [Phytophthora sojae]|uniref:Uncharacterized protein n=1 Tax=Phytophthora sojae (strain P6497) TaxID=1094619 RepID=G4YV67_PHYSP|nr:hypothetical protein PHYSODRAFT_260121 [Phytophthora sojae]EGZ24366.1 hypothetical protein PHYSODRAFT_260121 [Phytophthora sojae]|eukprot:XP_009519654.1 hypothetical protein PHYSODRAFT_260121 [Phytophthora sojae]